MPDLSPRCRAAGALVVATLLPGLVWGCASADQPQRQHDIILQVMDGNVREPGVECAGARPFLYVHAGARFDVTDAGGEVLASGPLPPGVAVEAFNDDLEVDRVPTFCVFTVSIELPDRAAYRLVLEEGDPVSFTSTGTVRVSIP